MSTYTFTDLSVTTAIAPAVTTVGTGGITPISAPTGFANWQPIAATSGTDTTPADGTQFVTSLYVPANCTVNGVGYLVGSVGGTNKVYAVLYDSAGAVLAYSSITGGGATVGTAAQIQTLAFATPAATYALKGPGTFFIGVSINGTTARLRTVPIYTGNHLWCGSVSQTQGTSPTVAAITAPSAFADAKAPVLYLY